jgi:hypothetical protein
MNLAFNNLPYLITSYILLQHLNIDYIVKTSTILLFFYNDEVFFYDYSYHTNE